MRFIQGSMDEQLIRSSDFFGIDDEALGGEKKQQKFENSFSEKYTVDVLHPKWRNKASSPSCYPPTCSWNPWPKFFRHMNRLPGRGIQSQFVPFHFSRKWRNEILIVPILLLNSP